MNVKDMEDLCSGDFVWVKGSHVGAKPHDEYHAVNVETIFTGHCSVSPCADVAVTVGGMKWHVALAWLEPMGSERDRKQSTSHYEAGVRDGYQARDCEWGAALASHVPEGTDPMDPESVSVFLGNVSVDVAVNAERVTRIFKCLEKMTKDFYTIPEETTCDEQSLIAMLFPGRNLGPGDTLHLDVTGRGGAANPLFTMPSGGSNLSGGTIKMSGCTSTPTLATKPRLYSDPKKRQARLSELTSKGYIRGKLTPLERAEFRYLLDEEEHHLRQIKATKLHKEIEEEAKPKWSWRKFFTLGGSY
jgi:hypothetical protein